MNTLQYMPVFNLVERILDRKKLVYLCTIKSSGELTGQIDKLLAGMTSMNE